MSEDGTPRQGVSPQRESSENSRERNDSSPTVVRQPSENTTATLPPPSPAPEWIGNYRVIRKLGEGGMGVVYEAEQQQPRRPVALKVIRDAHLFSEERIKMFRREAQSLARLKHAGIAAIYESGRTEQGVHYFAMELVRGRTLAEFFRGRPAAFSSRDELKLRLGIFRKVCEAVNYAHQRGVIHRDLKPSNLVVVREATLATPDDGRTVIPEVKILDFGLARIADSDMAVTTVITEVGRAMGTLPYMSPEQVLGNPDELDLRTDVYSLGVILYELLSGQVPYVVSGTPLLEAIRIICQEKPKSLSRSTRGVGRIDADLETIVLKSLEKEPARRYQSALALSEDLGRYLSGQPILAHPPSAVYQVRKLILRHKAGFAAGFAGVLLLAGLAIGMSLLAERAMRERDRANLEAESARQISEFLTSLFKVSDPLQGQPKDMTARELLDKGAEKIRRELNAQPLLQARLMDTIGTVYITLNMNEEATRLIDSAMEIRKRILGSDSTEYARSLMSRTSIHRGQTSLEDYLSMRLQALAIFEKNLGEDDLEIAQCLQGIGNIQWSKGETKEALASHRRALAIFEKQLGPEHLKVAWALNNIGNVMIAERNFAAAAPLFERSLRIKEAQLGPDHPDVAFSMGNLGYVFVETGDFERAIPLVARSSEIIEKAYGSQHTYTGIGLHNMGDLLRRMGRDGEARPYLERAVAIQETRSPKDLAECLHTLARVLENLGESRLAEEDFQRSLKIREKLMGDNHPLIAATLNDYAEFLRKQARPEEASRLESRAASIRAANDSTAAKSSP
jgi:serine/threonine protein kinase/Tfp pilus assembly protein PilF